MNTCAECGGRIQQEVLKCHEETLAGIPLLVRNAAIRRFCAECGEDMIAIPDMPGLIAAAAMARCLVPIALIGKDLRFLRKALEMTGREFAQMMDNAPETVSRWESDDQGIGGYAEKILRQKVCEHLKARAPAIDYDPAMIIDMTILRTGVGVVPPTLVFEPVLFKGCGDRRKSRRWDTASVEWAA